MVDIPGNSTTTNTISVGGSITDSLEVRGDHDWIRIQLTAGQSISVLLDGLSLEDPYLRILDANGNVVYENDDISSGVNRDSLIAFTATYTGTYFIDVAAWEPDPGDDVPGYTGTGTYTLSVSPYTPPPLGTVQQLADYLVSGHWGGDERHFNVTPGGSITVNLSALTGPGQTLAIAALAAWTDVTGVNFVQVANGGQIIFDDNQEGAFSTSTWSNGIITSSRVNVSVAWIGEYGTSLNSYSFQTYIHEIGHALGLGHQGGYNGEARYPYDAEYQNDGWPMSVMSYFDQTDNTYFAGQGFDFNFITTPMMADILAMSMLYGLSTTTRTGNSFYTAYGPGQGAFCIYDSGGIDTISAPIFAGAQTINLNPGTFSNLGGSVGNLSIALGVTIENAVGAESADKIIGNSSNNLLNGAGGNDTLFGGDGDDNLDGGAGVDELDGGAGNDQIIYDAADNMAKVTGGAGTDTLVVNGTVAPTSFNLAAQGFERAEVRQTDSGSNPWTTITKNYNSSWTLLQQVTVNDNGSRHVVDYDYNNSLATVQVESIYNFQGMLSSVDQLFDNGTRTFINLDETGAFTWNQDWFQYDALGRLSSEDVLHDNGTRTFVNFDEASNQSWSQDWFQYDAQGRLSSQDIHHDDGTRTFINLDESGTQSWTQDWFAYDAQGRLSSEDVRYDIGTRTFINLDQDNSQSWNQAWFNYDAQGRLDTQDVLYDDGSRIFYNYDQAGTEAFAVSAILYNTAGTAYQQVITWDDGSTTYTMI
ncbi:MAG: M10 family metallopeptidase C-terminal domain-containing protein [Pseudomonadota bacterium]|nr:M10 family metallopeptidase C-terminal domain-containing protein [Pseudomonadota bacterium]